MSDSYEDCFETAVRIARQAGVVIVEALKDEKKVEAKSCFADLVTETDQLVEKMIISEIRKFFIGEESHEGSAELTDNPTWIIDPIDGTNNFVHRFPVIAVSIALVANKKAVLGIVYNPVRDEMFTAKLGLGAFLNDSKISCSKVDDLSNALVCAEFGSSRDPVEVDAKFVSMRNVIQKVHGIRSNGSAAVNMCYVAAGRADAYWEFGLHAWDMAAGDLIVREAGGVVTNTKGGELDLLAREILCASTPQLANLLYRDIEPIPGLKRD